MSTSSLHFSPLSPFSSSSFVSSPLDYLSLPSSPTSSSNYYIALSLPSDLEGIDSRFLTHPGIVNTWELIRQHYEGPRLKEFIEEYIKGCTKCQKSKTNLPWRKAPLQPFNVPASKGPFQYVSMDLITDLPKSDGFDSILTIVDQGCSKAAKFIPCHKMIDGPGIALEYLKHLVPKFEVPFRIISDRDPHFASTFSLALCRNLGIQQNLSTAFHPRTDG